MDQIDGEPLLDLPSRDDFDRWLDAHGPTQRAVGLRMAKQASGLQAASGRA